MQPFIMPDIQRKDWGWDPGIARYTIHPDEVTPTNPRNLCDWCGTLGQGRLRRSHGAQLCKGCYGRLCIVPAGKMRRCVERFLIGNVV
jgi:hypothetical protein